MERPAAALSGEEDPSLRYQRTVNFAQTYLTEHWQPSDEEFNSFSIRPQLEIYILEMLIENSDYPNSVKRFLEQLLKLYEKFREEKPSKSVPEFDSELHELLTYSPGTLYDLDQRFSFIRVRLRNLYNSKVSAEISALSKPNRLQRTSLYSGLLKEFQTTHNPLLLRMVRNGFGVFIELAHECFADHARINSHLPLGESREVVVLKKATQEFTALTLGAES